MRVLLDENLSPEIARLLRARGIDAVSAHEIGRSQLADRAQLTLATADGRAIVTRDAVDVLILAGQMIAANTEHAGIIVVPASLRGNELLAIADGIHAIVTQYPDGLQSSVLYLQRPRSA